MADHAITRRHEEELDQIDRRILKLLQANGRMTNAALAESVGLTATPMLNRIKKLEERGVIRGYAALVDRMAIGQKVMALVAVQMTGHSLEGHEGFVGALGDFGEVLECHHVAGEDDYVLKVVVGDLEEFEHFLVRRLTRVPGISRVRTTFVMSSPKSETAIPIEGGTHD